MCVKSSRRYTLIAYYFMYWFYLDDAEKINLKKPDAGVKTMPYVHTLEYDLSIKGTKVPVHGTTWIRLKNITFSERN